jgi:imidazolonepropionase-like amidohydrolase
MKLAIATLLLLLAVASAQLAAAPIVLDHVTIIDATGVAAKPNMRVEINDHRIVSIAPSSAARPDNHGEVIDASGKYLIPGLWDFHVHTGQRDIYLPLYVANGITGVRDMGGDLEEPTGYSSARYVQLNQWREAIEDGTLIGPHMVLAGYQIDGYPWPGNVTVTTAQEGRQAVAALQRTGVDFIKVKSGLSRASYLAIAEEAKRRGMTLAGHVPTSVRVVEASAAGQKSVAHLNGIALASSANEARFMGEPASAFEARDRERYNRAETQAEASFDDRAATASFATLVKNSTWQVPTLVELRRSALGFSADDPHWKYMPEKLRVEWRKVAGLRSGSGPQQHFTAALHLTKKMHVAGGLFIAGTDSANASLVPGFSLHQELILLVAAGFTPMQALQSATLNPARYLGRDQDLGTIEVGKVADLVLLDANPLDDIANTQRIRAVVVNGRFFDRASLNLMLHDVEIAASR